MKAVTEMVAAVVFDSPARRQRGAALLIVLLLVATLSFIVLSISDRMVLASSRSANARVRAELVWRVFGAEVLSKSALEAAVTSDGFKFTPENPFFKTASDAPMEGGGAVIAFRDATRCFNVNALAKAEGGNRDRGSNPRLSELERLLDALGMEDANPKSIAASIADWIDTDNFENAQGAEDGRYAGLPAPYRTGGGPIADISEIRAVAEVGAKAYREMLPVLCALPSDGFAPLNINMLTKEDAPLLVALTGDEVTLAAAETAIENRPVGGYASAEQFWSDPAFAGKEISEEVKGRVKLTSQFIAADAAIRFQDQRAAVRFLFELSEGGDARLVSRRIGPVFE